MDNAGFTVAAYMATFLILGTYTWRVNRRLARARSQAARP
jgi:hypothetical protein